MMMMKGEDFLLQGERREVKTQAKTWLYLGTVDRIFD